MTAAAVTSCRFERLTTKAPGFAGDTYYMSNTVSTLLGAQEGIVKFEKMARLSPLGAGGRGEVYKARDTRLEESQRTEPPANAYRPLVFSRSAPPSGVTHAS